MLYLRLKNKQIDLKDLTEKIYFHSKDTNFINICAPSSI